MNTAMNCAIRSDRERTLIGLRSTGILWILAGAWCAAIACGIWKIHTYESTPGALGLTPTHWPAQSGIAPDRERATLVMLVHPQCSCTRASLEELQAIMTRAGGRVSAWVLFEKPTGMVDGWEASATWTQARRIPGVTVRLDADEIEAARFGALTSGHVVLYDRRGTLLFSGGITAARGHAGDNLGREEVLANLDGGAPGVGENAHAVYGCAL